MKIYIVLFIFFIAFIGCESDPKIPTKVLEKFNVPYKKVVKKVNMENGNVNKSYGTIHFEHKPGHITKISSENYKDYNLESGLIKNNKDLIFVKCVFTDSDTDTIIAILDESCYNLNTKFDTALVIPEFVKLLNADKKLDKFIMEGHVLLPNNPISKQIMDSIEKNEVKECDVLIFKKKEMSREYLVRKNINPSGSTAINTWRTTYNKFKLNQISNRSYSLFQAKPYMYFNPIDSVTTSDNEFFFMVQSIILNNKNVNIVFSQTKSGNYHSESIH